MTAGFILLWIVSVAGFGIGVAKQDRWAIAGGLLGQALVLWEALAP